MLYSSFVEFSNDYKIVLCEKNHVTRKINLQDNNSTQMINQSKIKCPKCWISKAKIYQN